ncbi:hypothetical protein BB560_006746 [Smittium megazygosporum]|uniref:Major facilitator superfamily (MFS) profile domain-containing protein n=1 Tax=Smittium megazygosporum TaxID=133381 RepID=A0A2T9Y227_9FUNG|nr:hypothetical protein BB560_006746 [Smittium megazygosporum]
MSEKGSYKVPSNGDFSDHLSDPSIPAPDGKRAFLIMFFCVLINVATTGVSNSFPVYQTYYLEKFGEGNGSSIGWIGTILLAAMLLFSIVASPIIAKIGYKYTCLLGGFIGAVGLLLASFSSKIWQLALTNGLLFGFGTALPFLCAVTMISMWFDKYRGLGMGLINSGGGIGGIILSPIIKWLIKDYSFATSMRVICVFVFVAVGISAIFLKRRIPESGETIVFDTKAVYDPFVFLIGISTLFGDIAYTIPLYYLPTIVLNRGGSDSASTTSVMLANIGNITGSIAMGFLADKIGEMNIIIIADVLVAILVPAIWQGTHNVSSIQGLSFCYGFLSAAFLSIVPSILGRHYDHERAPGVISVLFVYVAIGLIIGGPIAGAVWDRCVKINNYAPLSIMCAAGFFVSALLLVVAQIYIRKKNRGKFGFNL